MRTIQQNLISMVKERTARKHLAVVVCMIAIATAFAVFWSLRISGITLANAEPSCGLEEHTHTDACYDWVATETDGTEAIEETEVTEMGEETEVTETGNGTDEAAAETTGASGSADSEEESEKAAEESTEASVSASGEDASADEDTLAEEDASADEETAKEDAASDETDEDTASVTGTESGETAAAYTEEGTESVTEAIAEDGTEEATEELTEQETESLQPGDTKVVDGVTYVYELICEMEEHGEFVKISDYDSSTDGTPTAIYIFVETVATKADNEETPTAYLAAFNNLGEGTYVIVESVTPDGYNTATPVLVTIKANYDQTSGTLSSWTVTYRDVDSTTEATTITEDSTTSGETTTYSGTYTFKIKNQKGSTLPTTGGIGTTIFYVVGAILVLGAAVILVTRRRMANR